MAYLLDTTVLARLANVNDAKHGVATGAVLQLHRQGEGLHITPQIIVEFRNVATRPLTVNGLGLSTAETQGQIAAFEGRFALLEETRDIYPAWKDLVASLGVIGKQVHDARLVAICHLHAVTHLLTFNVRHFVRMAAYGPGLVVVDPANV